MSTPCKMKGARKRQGANKHQARQRTRQRSAGGARLQPRGARQLRLLRQRGCQARQERPQLLSLRFSVCGSGSGGRSGGGGARDSPAAPAPGGEVRLQLRRQAVNLSLRRLAPGSASALQSSTRACRLRARFFPPAERE